jgi:hypothetical protein
MVNKMNQTKLVDTKALMEAAKDSRDKEAYKLLEKSPLYRIGVGARTNSPNLPSFFIEVIVRLSTENGEVSLPRLQKTLHMLKELQKRGYSLTYQDDNSISCEIATSIHEISQECETAKSLVNRKKSASRHKQR